VDECEWSEKLEEDTVMYHITFKENVPRILKEGLKAGTTTGWTKPGIEHGRIFLAADASSAGKVAYELSHSAFAGKKSWQILSILVPRGTRVYEDESGLDLGANWYSIKRKIPARNILEAGVFSIPQTGGIRYENLPWKRQDILPEIATSIEELYTEDMNVKGSSSESTEALKDRMEFERQQEVAEWRTK